MIVQGPQVRLFVLSVLCDNMQRCDHITGPIGLGLRLEGLSSSQSSVRGASRPRPKNERAKRAIQGLGPQGHADAQTKDSSACTISSLFSFLPPPGKRPYRCSAVSRCTREKDHVHFQRFFVEFSRVRMVEVVFVVDVAIIKTLHSYRIVRTFMRSCYHLVLLLPPTLEVNISYIIY